MKVMITGATGFVGRRLIKALMDDPKVEMLCPGRRQELLKKLEANHPGRIHSVLKPIEDLLPSDFPFAADAVIHLASAIDAPTPEAMTTANVQGTTQVLQWAWANKTKHFIYISTSYARRPDPSNLYGVTKQQAEQAVAASGLAFTILRPSIIYGPGDTRNFGKIARLVSLLPVIPVFGGGALLQPLYADDLARAIKKILLNPKAMNKTYDIGGPERVTLAEWVRLYLKVQKKKRIVINIPMPLLAVMAAAAERVLPSAPLTRAKLQRWAGMPASDNTALLQDLELPLTPLAEGLKRLSD